MSKVITDRWDDIPTVPMGFDVTCVIGHVSIDPFGDGPSPTMVAMGMIVDHDAEGCFTFPLPNGDTQYVTIERKSCNT